MWMMLKAMAWYIIAAPIIMLQQVYFLLPKPKWWVDLFGSGYGARWQPQPPVRDATQEEIADRKVCQECKNWRRRGDAFKIYRDGLCTLQGSPRRTGELQTCDGFEKRN